jgi:3-mercaptopyruvate sulfurtransferase SseA
VTSARVALLLRRKGVQKIRPLAGGFDGWREKGFPVTGREEKAAAVEHK